ncbi:MAG: DUF4491 family protein [Muribaculaceae bacterium]|jgi:hypothetical protein|nr:DUF4491 family protein [Muribaculaceae bacterium]
MEFLETYHLLGLTLGICTFIIIGVFHPIVIKSEYYFGVRCWWVFLILGIVGAALSVWASSIFASTLLGVFSFTSFWAILEIHEQQDRVRKGWFPRNPKRIYPFDKPSESRKVK